MVAFSYFQMEKEGRGYKPWQDVNEDDDNSRAGCGQSWSGMKRVHNDYVTIDWHGHDKPGADHQEEIYKC